MNGASPRHWTLILVLDRGGRRRTLEHDVEVGLEARLGRVRVAAAGLHQAVDHGLLRHADAVEHVLGLRVLRVDHAAAVRLRGRGPVLGEARRLVGKIAGLDEALALRVGEHVSVRGVGLAQLVDRRVDHSAGRAVGRVRAGRAVGRVRAGRSAGVRARRRLVGRRAARVRRGRPRGRGHAAGRVGGVRALVVAAGGEHERGDRGRERNRE